MVTNENSIVSVPDSPGALFNRDEIPSSQTVPLSWVLDFSHKKESEIKGLRQQLVEANTVLFQAFNIQREAPPSYTHQDAPNELRVLKKQIADLEADSDSLRDQLRNALNANFQVLGDEGNRDIEEHKKLNIQLREQIANLETINEEHVESMTEMMQERDEIGWGEKLKNINNQLREQIANLENTNQQLIERVKKIARENKELEQRLYQPKFKAEKARLEEEKKQVDEMKEYLTVKLVTAEKQRRENRNQQNRLNDMEKSMTQTINDIARLREKQQPQGRPEPAEATKQAFRTTLLDGGETRAAFEAFVAKHRRSGAVGLNGYNGAGAELPHRRVSQPKVADKPPSLRVKTRRGNRGKRKLTKVPIFHGLSSETTEDWKDNWYGAIKQFAGPNATDSQLIGIARQHIDSNTATAWFSKYCRRDHGMKNFEDPNVVYPFTWETFIRDFGAAWNTGGFQW